MKVIRDIIKDGKPEPCVATIGFFDGVHLGHKALVKQVRTIAKNEHLKSMVITFAQHPRRVMHNNYQPHLLTTPQEKVFKLAQTGVDYCYMLPFTKDMAALPAKEFMAKHLRDELGVEVLVMGYDHRFGHEQDALFDDYKAWGDEVGIKVLRADACSVEGERVSSSAIRTYLQLGDVERAGKLLGMPYAIEGKVIKGQNIGHTLGFPTANIDAESVGKKLPLDGVYAVRIPIRGGEYAGMLNVGTRPTINDADDRTVEVHILNFGDDIYGETLRIEFFRRIRATRKFNSREELKEQLRHDAERVDRIMNL